MVHVYLILLVFSYEMEVLLKNIAFEKGRNSQAKRERFIRIGERRVNRILDDLDSLGKCANKKNYEYDNKDVRTIFQAVDKKIKEIKVLYQNLNEKKKSFTLKDK